MSGQYEVLSPWAEADPVPLKGITPRLNDLSGRRIGLFSNSKRTSRPILAAIETRLKERFPDCETTWYDAWETYNLPYWVVQVESDNKGIFEDWLKGVDAVIHATGD